MPASKMRTTGPERYRDRRGNISAELIDHDCRKDFLPAYQYLLKAYNAFGLARQSWINKFPELRRLKTISLHAEINDIIRQVVAEFPPPEPGERKEIWERRKVK